MNKKVKNSTPCIFNNIQFRSILEKNCYIVLKQSNLIVEYEAVKFILFTGCETTKPLVYYKSSVEIIEKGKLRNMTWLPDYIVTNSKGHKFVVEAKGNPNDLFPLKLKMFRASMENLEYKAVIVVNSKRDCQKAITYIKAN